MTCHAFLWRADSILGRIGRKSQVRGVFSIGALNQKNYNPYFRRGALYSPFIGGSLKLIGGLLFLIGPGLGCIIRAVLTALLAVVKVKLFGDLFSG